MQNLSKLSYKALVATVLVSFIALTFSFIALSNQVAAAGVDMTITPSEVPVSDPGPYTLSFTPTSVFNNADDITIFYDSAYDDTSFTGADVTVTKAGDANYTSATSSVDTVADTVTITLTTGGALDTTNAFSIDFADLVAPATKASYSFSMTSTAGDYSTVLQYVGDDNDVFVTATVGPSISLNIRTQDDTADLSGNACDLGAVTTLDVPNTDLVDDGVGECGYSVAMGTNAAGGAQVQVNANGPLTNGTHNMTDVANSANFSTASEQYGFANITAPTALTENGNFSTDATPVPTTASNFVSASAPFSYEAAIDNTDVTQVMHGLRIDSSTPAGSYTQTVTYTATPIF
jgi:hypothetical protein